MAQENDFREPVFVRNDDTTNVKVRVIEWAERNGGGFSIQVANGDESVLISVDDWAAIKSCVDAELNRVQ